MDRRIACLVTACLLLAASLFVFRDLLAGQLPPGATGLVAARDAAGPWAETIAAGRMPLWQSAPGGPALALPAAQAFYPLRLLHVPFGATAGLVILLVLQLALFGAGIYALARALGRSPGASLLAALGAELSPPIAAASGDPAVFASLCLAPWPVVFAVRTSRHLRLVDAALAGALAGGVALAGSLELAGVVAVASGLALAGGLGRGGARLVALALIAGAIALLLPAVQWLPYLEASAAGLLDPSIAGPTPGPGELLRVALPFTGAEPPRLPGSTDPWSAAHLLRTLYLGGPLLVLALARPAHGDARRTLPAAFALGGIAVAPLIAAIAARLLPGLGTIDPVTLAAPALLTLPLLAGFGVDALAGDRRASVVRKPVTGSRLALEATVALLASVAAALSLFATDAGILVSLSVAWLLGAVVVTFLVVRGLGAVDAAALPAVLTVLVVADLAGVHLLSSPLAPPIDSAAVLPIGAHPIDPGFRPALWQTGLAMSAAGVALFGLAFVPGRRRTRKTDPLAGLKF